MRRADPSSREVLPNVCVLLIEIKRNNKPLLQEWLDRADQTKNEERNRNLPTVGILSL
jgi:hypothetical protein